MKNLLNKLFGSKPEPVVPPTEPPPYSPLAIKIASMIDAGDYALMEGSADGDGAYGTWEFPSAGKHLFDLKRRGDCFSVQFGADTVRFEWYEESLIRDALFRSKQRRVKPFIDSILAHQPPTPPTP